MKITSVTALPFAPDKIPDSYGITATRNYVAVKVTTDEGVSGWGDATCGPLSVSAMVDEFGRLLVGKDPSRIEEHWQTLYHHFFVRGGPIQVSAISGIELALWDIKGKVLGVPIYAMRGGLMRDRIWAYGRWDGLTPEEAAEHALRNVSEGLTALKGDPFDHMGLFITREAEKKAIEDGSKSLKEALKSEDIYSNSWAVIIGIDKYENAESLKYAVNDAHAVKELLLSKFSYQAENIKYLTNEKATMRSIKKSLYEIAKKAGALKEFADVDVDGIAAQKGIDPKLLGGVLGRLPGTVLSPLEEAFEVAMGKVGLGKLAKGAIKVELAFLVAGALAAVAGAGEELPKGVRRQGRRPLAPHGVGLGRAAA